MNMSSVKNKLNTDHCSLETKNKHDLLEKGISSLLANHKQGEYKFQNVLPSNTAGVHL